MSFARNQKKWDHRFLELAKSVAQWSKDRSRKVGCVLVSEKGEILSTGYNGFPRGCFDEGNDVPDSTHTVAEKARVEARHDRPAKYQWTEHAERNAIYAAARNGVRLQGAIAYVPWYPCADCARALIQAGISRLVCYKPDFDDPKWGSDFRVVDTMLQEARMEVTAYE